MTAISKNLGLIKAIHEGVNPPQNIKILWYNTNPSVYKHFYYDTVATAWLPLTGSGGGGGSQSLQQVTDIGNTTTNDVQFGAGKGVLLDNGSRLREGTIDAGFGGTKGIAQICAVGYELKWEAGRLYVMDGNGLLIRHSLYNFTTLPSATDDSSKGYYVGSLWTLDDGVSYICTDSTPTAATWDIYEATPQVNSDWSATSGPAEILNKPVIDSIPADGSSNAVSSDGVFDALALKADLVSGKVPSSQLPSYVDDVLEYANFASLPVTGETGKIYVTLDSNKTYRWSGTSYTEISSQQLQVIDVANFTSLPVTGATNTLYQTVNDNRLYRWDTATSTYIAMNGTTSSTLPGPEDGALLFADLATTEALKACTYSNGTAGVSATLTGSANGILSELTAPGKIDQVTPAVDMFILVKNQVNAIHNGIYAIQQLGSISTPFILERIDDYDETAEVYPSQVTINRGVDNLNKIFNQKTVDPIIGTDNILFEPISPTISQEIPVIFVHTVTVAALPTCIYAAGTLVPSKPGYGATLTASAIGPLGTINGVTIQAGMRILVRNQVNPAHNGDYVVIKPGSLVPASRWQLQRLSYTSQQMLFVVKEWCVNSPISTSFGERYALTNTSFLNSQVGTVALNFTLHPGTSIIAPSSSSLKHTVKAAVALTIGQAVYVSSANGTNMIVSKADYSTEATSSKTMGLIAQSLAINGIGFVITEGLLAGLNTASAAAGDPVWLGANGDLIYGLVNKPSAPNHMVFIGIVTRANSSNGEIFVKAQNGFEVEELHNMQDVDYSSAIGADSFLIKDSTTSLWKRLSFANLRTILQASFDTVYTTTAAVATQITTALAASGSGADSFSPQPVSVADTAATAGTDHYYYQTVSEVTKTLSKMVVWGYSGTDNIIVGVYRGRLKGPAQTATLTLIGKGTAVGVVGPNAVTLTAIAGQNLNVVAGEYLVVALYTGGISFRFLYKPGISDVYFGQTSSTTITNLPNDPTNAASPIRFACTLY